MNQASFILLTAANLQVLMFWMYHIPLHETFRQKMTLSVNTYLCANLTIASIACKYSCSRFSDTSFKMQHPHLGTTAFKVYLPVNGDFIRWYCFLFYVTWFQEIEKQLKRNKLQHIIRDIRVIVCVRVNTSICLSVLFSRLCDIIPFFDVISFDHHIIFPLLFSFPWARVMIYMCAFLFS
jgi:hypothetical protein